MLKKQHSRISHHTLTTSGSAFTIPSGSIEDFTLGTWEITDLALSEIGVNEGDGTVAIRVGSDIKEFVMSGSAVGVDTIYTADGTTTSDRTVDADTNQLSFTSNDGADRTDLIALDSSETNYGTGIVSEDSNTGELAQIFASPTAASISITDSVYQGAFQTVYDSLGDVVTSYIESSDVSGKSPIIASVSTRVDLSTGEARIDLAASIINADGTIPAYADDSDAGTNGLSTGDIFQTDGTGASPLNVAGILMIKQ